MNVMHCATSTPLVSVIIPVFNLEAFIGNTLDSVLAQTFETWEAIVIDDCSADRTPEILEQYATRDPRIRWFRQPFNQGAGRARNRALNLARGRYLAFLDGDDVWEPRKLDRQLEFMKESQSGFSCTAYRIEDEEGVCLGQVDGLPGWIDYKFYLTNTIIGCSTVMLDCSIVGVPHFSDLQTRQDTCLWLSLLRQGYRCAGIQETLATYRVRKGSLSRNKWKAAKQVWMIYRNIEKLNLYMALFCFSRYAINGFLKNWKGLLRH